MAFNYHHTVWERSKYQSPFERKFAEHSGLVVPAHVTRHDNLHRNLIPPTRPDHNMMAAILETLGEDEFSLLAEQQRGYIKRPRIKELPEDRFAGLDQVVELMTSEAEVERSDYRAMRELQFAKHLLRQRDLLEGGF